MSEIASSPSVPCRLRGSKIGTIVMVEADAVTRSAEQNRVASRVFMQADLPAVGEDCEAKGWIRGSRVATLAKQRLPGLS